MHRSSRAVASLALTLAGLLSCANSASAQYPPPTTQQTQAGTPAAVAPPAYTPVRWNENYAYLKDASKRTDFWDPFKYVAIGDDSYVSLGGQARYRYEWFDENNFGGGPQDDDGYHLTRTMLHAGLHVGEYLRGFVQGISAFGFDRDGGDRPQDEDELDLHQGFLDVKVPVGDTASVTVRGGRQNLLYGAQRLISPLDWSNVRRTFDGGKIMIVCPDNQLDLFVVQPVVVDEDEFNDNDNDTVFAGAYDTLNLPNFLGKSANSKLEAYLLYLDKDTNATVLTESETWTVGARLSSNPKPWDFDVELDYQFGEVGDDIDISAWSVALEGGYTFADATFAPRVYLGFDIASGDDEPADGDFDRFNQLFPLGHAYFGYIDVVGRQNIIDLHPGVQFKFSKSLNLRIDYHLFWRESEDDGLFDAGGALLLADNGTDDRFIGSELDLLLNWQVDRHLLAYLGYSHFFAGDFGDDFGSATGADEDIDFVYAALVYTF